MSLYLKYRPKNLDDLVGQNHIQQTLRNAIAQNKVSHAYIFSGPRGTGKTSSARLIAKAVVCGDNEQLLAQADRGQMVDIIEIDAASNRGIDEIRELREKIQFAPVIGKAKVYIVDEVHMLTKEAFNALLKTLEEPPSHAYFVLATTEIHKVPETILSRCQHFNFQRISVKDISDRLAYICEKEGWSYEKEALDIIADNAAGGLRDAISSLEQMSSGDVISLQYVEQYLGITSSKIVEAFASELILGNAQTALEALETITNEGHDLLQFSRELIEHLREKMLKHIENGENPERVIEVIEAIQKASLSIKISPISQLPLEIACVQLAKNLNGEAKEERGGGILSAFTRKSNEKKEEKEEQSSVKEAIKEEKEERKEKEKEEETGPVSLEKELTLESLQKSWPQIIDTIPTAIVKTAVKSTNILSLDDDVLTLGVTTDFYLDTLKNGKGNGELILAIDSIFHKRLKLKVEKKDNEINLDTKAREAVKEEEKKEENTGPSIADMADEIFGN